MKKYILGVSLIGIILYGCGGGGGGSNNTETPRDSESDAGDNSADNDAAIINDSGVKDAGKSCDVGYSLCGTKCIQQGNTCCASVGFPELSCPNGGTCDPSGICTGSCVVDTSLTCTDSSLTVWSCTGSNTPQETQSNLNCSLPTVGVGQTLYCCVPQCTFPKGTYSYVFTTTSGNCGDVNPNSGVVFNGTSNLILAAEYAELSPGTSTLQQGTQNVSINSCTGSVSASFTDIIYGSPTITGTTVVSIESNQNGTSLTGTVSLTENNSSGPVCNGTYSFVATQTSP